MGCFLDDLRTFGINADQWTTAARDEEEWRKTAGKGVERSMVTSAQLPPRTRKNAQNGGKRSGTFYGEINRCRESWGWTKACSSIPKRDGEDQRQDSPKQACSGCFTYHS